MKGDVSAKKPLYPLVTAAAQLIRMGGLTQPCFTFLKTASNEPAPEGLCFVRFDAQHYGSVRLALIWSRMRRRVIIIDCMVDNPDAALIPYEFLKPALSWHQVQKEKPEALNAMESASFLGSMNVRQGAVIANLLSNYIGMEKSMRYARKMMRQDMRDLFNLGDNQMRRLEKRADFMIENLNLYLAEQGARCELRIIFDDGNSFDAAFHEPSPPESPT